MADFDCGRDFFLVFYRHALDADPVC